MFILEDGAYEFLEFKYVKTLLIVSKTHINDRIVKVKLIKLTLSLHF